MSGSRRASTRSCHATPARQAIVELLGDQRRQNSYMRDLLRASSAYRALDARDRAFCQRACLGVMATRGTLDELLARHTKKLDPRLRDALRLSVWELAFAETPARVAVSQGVELAGSAAPHARGMANAVLHRIAEDDAPKLIALRERVGQQEQLPEADLAMAYGLPVWLVARVCSERGSQAAVRYACAALEPAPMWVRLNDLASEEAYAEARELVALAQATETDLPGCYYVRDAAMIASSEALHRASIVVADYAAQQVAALVAPQAGSQVLEVGQGRGTKTLLLQLEALRSSGLCSITAIDSAAYKVRIASERLRPYLRDSLRSLAFDGTQLASANLPPELDQSFDTVFVDAPCSGTGTLRRHPEIAWDLDPASLEADREGSIVALQRRLLAAASAHVAAGGTLAYATCSVLSEENEAQVEAFLASEAGREFELIAEPFQTLPAPGAPDGHFCARFVRR